MGCYQESLVTEVCKRKTLSDQLLGLVQIRIATVRRGLGYSALTNEEVADFIASAMGHAVYRALAARYMAEHGLDNAWLLEKRKEYDRKGWDRTWDSEIVRQEFPDFDDYLPHPNLTDSEILAWAKKDFYDLVSGYGTDYYHHYDKHRQKYPQRAKEWPMSVSADSVEDFDISNICQSPTTPLGVGYDKALMYAVQEFGTAGVFWFLNWAMFPRQYKRILNVMGYHEEDVGYNEFQNVRQELLRKMPKVEERVMELLRDDPEMAELYETVRGIPPLAKAG